MTKPFQIVELLHLGIFPNAYGSDSPGANVANAETVSVVSDLNFY